MGKYFNKENDSNTNLQASEFVVRDGVLMKYNGNSESVEVPGNVRKICSGAFSGCGFISTLNIPDSVEEIEFYTFCSCYSLKKVTVGLGMTVIPMGCFAELPMLEEVILTDKIEQIDDFAFRNCKSLTNIVFRNIQYRDPITAAEKGRAFELRLAGLSPKIEYIGDTCSTPKIKKIGNYAFRGCTALDVEDIKANAIDVGYEAFDAPIVETVVEDDLDTVDIDDATEIVEDTTLIVSEETDLFEALDDGEESIEEDIDTSNVSETVEVIDEENDIADEDSDRTVVIETADDEYKSDIEHKDFATEDIDVVLQPIIEDPVVKIETIATDDAEPEKEDVADEDTVDELDAPIIEGVELKDGQIYYGGECIEDASIAVLNLSARSYNCMCRAQVKEFGGGTVDVKVSDLLAYTRGALMQVRNLGKKSAEEIVEKLQNYVLERASGQATIAVGERITLAPQYEVVDNVIVHIQTGKVVPNVHISRLSLSVRAMNSLARGEITLLSELMQLTPRQLQNFPNMGAKTVLEIADYVPKYLDAHQVDEIVEEHTVEALPGTFYVSMLPDELTDIPTLGSGYAFVDGMIVGRRTLKAIPDEPITALDLSVRSYNCLTHSGRKMISDLIGLPFEEFKQIRNLGALSSNEIQEKLELYLDDKISKSNISTVLDSKVSATDVLKIFGEHEYEELSVEMLCTLLEDAEETDGLKVIARLCDEGRLEKRDELYALAHPSFLKIVLELEEKYSDYGLDERSASVIKLRADGATLEEVGSITNTTRERVRQIEKRAFWRLIQGGNAKLEEDKFAYLFTTYLVDKEFFFDYLQESKQLWYYLNLRYDDGKTHLSAALEDKKIPIEQRRAIEKFVYRGYIQIDGVYVPAQRGDIEDCVLEKCCKDEVSLDEFFDLYSSFLEEYAITDERLQVTETTRTTRANRLSDSMKLLWKQNQRIRYYDIEGGEYDELLDALNLEQYSDVEISTRKFILDYPDLMERYDIRDEYELHNLLKKIKADQTVARMQFGRMPHILFGEFNRDDFVKKMLFANAPIRGEELASKISAELGFRSDTVYLGWFSCISEYFRHGIYSIDYEEMPENHMSALKAALADDFYYMTEVSKIYKSVAEDADEKFLNSYNLKRMGFVVADTYIVQNHPTADAYFVHSLTSNDITNVAPISKRYSALTTYSLCLARLKDDLDIIEFEPYQYINIRKLEKLGITKEKLIEYRDCAWSFLSDDEFFSVKSLVGDGFDHELHSLGFMDLFYASILKSDKRFAWQRVGGAVVFNPRNEQFSVHDFLVHYINNVKSINIDDLVEELREKFGIELERSDVVQKVKGSLVYYDSIMETLYNSYETYYEEI